MGKRPVEHIDFRADTHRPKSRSKRRSKIRHVLAVAAGMFPLMSLFVWVMALFQLEVHRRELNRLAIIFLGCGMVFLMLYSLARAQKLRRNETSLENRERRRRGRAAVFEAASGSASLPKGD
jgi:arginine exporter protein ArgO